MIPEYGEGIYTFGNNKNCRGMEYSSKWVRITTSQMYMRACGIEQRLPGASFGPDRRDGYHLHAVLAGEGYLEINGKQQKVHAGQLFIIKQGENSYYYADNENPWYYTWVTFEGETVERYVKDAGFTDGINVLDSNVDIQDFLTIAKKILEHPQLTNSAELYRIEHAYNYLALAIESYEIGEKSSVSGKGLTAEDYIDYALAYMQGNYAQIRIGDVTKYIGINRTYFSRIFKQKMMISPGKYLQNIRMNRARELLLKTNLPIHVIASDVGYDDQLVFSKAFHKKCGVSPERYRSCGGEILE